MSAGLSLERWTALKQGTPVYYRGPAGDKSIEFSVVDAGTRRICRSHRLAEHNAEGWGFDANVVKVGDIVTAPGGVEYEVSSCVRNGSRLRLVAFFCGDVSEEQAGHFSTEPLY